MTAQVGATRESISRGAPRAASREMPRFQRVRRYGLAVLAVVMAQVLTDWLWPVIQPNISPLFFAAVMVSAWYGGLGPGLTATGLASFSSAFFFMNPYRSLHVGFDDLLRLMVFLMVALLISSLTSMRRRAEAAMRRAHDSLEQRVHERTEALRQSNESLQRQIRERQRAEEELRVSEERFRLLVQGVKDHAMFMLDASGRVSSWNAGAQQVFGYSREEIVGREFACLFPEDAVRRGDPHRVLSIATREQRCENEGWRQHKNGTLFWANSITEVLRDEDGNLRGFVKVTRDITERKNLEKAVLDISEREQRRIGHDLHDGLGQALTGIRFLSQALEQRLGSKAPAEAADAGSIAQLVQEAIAQTRELARGLSPVDLEEEGLLPALNDLARKVQEMFGLSCRFEGDRSLVIHDPSASAHLYRIAQEAVNNAVRHGKGQEIRINLNCRDSTVVLQVQDDGIGLPETTQRKGMGLSLMNYRARMIGGLLQVRRGPERGTIVTCTFENRPRPIRGDAHDPTSAI